MYEHESNSVRYVKDRMIFLVREGDRNHNGCLGFELCKGDCGTRILFFAEEGFLEDDNIDGSRVQLIVELLHIDSTRVLPRVIPLERIRVAEWQDVVQDLPGDFDGK